MGTLWYACEHPERPFDDDVRFHEPPKLWFGNPASPQAVTVTSFVVDGKDMAPKPCHGCDTAKAANMHRLAARARVASAGIASMAEHTRDVADKIPNPKGP